MEVVNRRELKFGVSKTDCIRLEQKLSQLLTPDPNNGPEGYNIRSLYFDSWGSEDFYAKIDGLENRKKIRLRIYHPTDTKVKLEIKRKMNINQRKETVTITRDDSRALIARQYDVLLKYDNPVARAAYNIMTIDQYYPKVLIDYKRKAFMHIENNIRVTIDSDIRSNEFDFDMFSPQTITLPVYDHWNALLEIKYNGDFFNWVTDAIGAEDSTYQSLSKYCVGRSFFDNFLS